MEITAKPQPDSDGRTDNAAGRGDDEELTEERQQDAGASARPSSATVESVHAEILTLRYTNSWAFLLIDMQMSPHCSVKHEL